jgi:phosphoglycolate phosphatase
MKKILFFDFDGTIVDCQKFQINRLKKVFLHFGVDVSNIDFLELIGPPLYNTFAKYMGEDRAMEVLNYYNTSFDPDSIADLHLFDGIYDMLCTLKQNGYIICLTSLQLYDIVDAELRYLGIRELFTNVFCDDPVRAYTSKVDLIKDVILNNHLNKNDIAVIGDTYNDVNAGIQNNLYTIAVDWGYGDIQNTEVNSIVHTTAQLVELLEKI